MHDDEVYQSLNEPAMRERGAKRETMKDRYGK